MCIKAGINVISTCEELSYPYVKYPQLSKKIDKLAKKHRVSVLGTGINPGFLMDTLPLILTTACQRVDSIKVTRMMDSSKRRLSYQKKIGTGLTKEEFMWKVKEQKISGHVGLVESIGMISGAMGWKLDEIKEIPPKPVISEMEINTSYTTIKAGCVAGIKSLAYGILKSTPIITLEFVSNVKIKKEYDAITIQGIPNISEKIIGGINGDIGTVALIINMIPKILQAKPGLKIMNDLPLAHCSFEDFSRYNIVKS
jgi:4-hydroxy-tetrahydrodipicolinate reductase